MRVSELKAIIAAYHNPMTNTDIINSLISLLERYKAHVTELRVHMHPIASPQAAQLKQETEDLHSEASDTLAIAKEHVAPVVESSSSSSSDSSLSSSELQSLSDRLGLPVVGPNGEVTHEPSASSSSSSSDSPQQGA